MRLKEIQMANKHKKKARKTPQQIFTEINNDADTIISILKSNNVDKKYTETILKLEDCRPSIWINPENNRIERQPSTWINPKNNCKESHLRYCCGKSICPICSFFKNRIEIAKFYKTYEMLKAKPEFKKAKLWLLTLKPSPHHLLETRNSVEFINKAFRKFMRYTQPKNSTQIANKWKGKSFIDLDVEYSKFLHVGFDNYLTFATVHLHVVLFTKPSFTGNNRITDIMMFERWYKATSSVDCYLHCVRITDTKQDAVDTMAYGLKTLKIKSAKKHPKKFLQLVEQLERKHKHSHAKGIRAIRAECNKQHKQSIKNKKPSNNSK